MDWMRLGAERVLMGKQSFLLSHFFHFALCSIFFSLQRHIRMMIQIGTKKLEVW